MTQNQTDLALGSKDEMRELAENIIDAYEMRVQTVSSMMEQAYELLCSHRVEMDRRLAELRDRLAHEQSLRHSDFGDITGDVVEARDRHYRQVSERLQEFEDEEGEMIGRLRRIVAAGKASDPAELDEIKEDIFTRQKKREKQVTRALRQFEMEQHELQAVLESLLDGGRKATVDSLRDTVSTLVARWRAREKETFSLVEQLEETRNRTLVRWQRVLGTTARGATGESR